MSASIDQALLSRRIIVTCGTGGVGKTTLSSALAFRAALLGKRAVVITIDPAKRLATSLGLKSLGDQPTDLTPQLRASLEKARPGSSRGIGTVAAIIPDTHETFRAFAYELAPNPETAERALNNPIFQIFSQEFSGANEYMAMERLYALDRTAQFDCIILDTPPSRNTMAFLNAPRLVAQMYEEKIIRWLVVPANRLVSVGMRKTLGLLEGLTGSGFMTNLIDFAAVLFEVQEPFAANLKKIIQLLESDQVGFLMVTTPSPDVTAEVDHFIQTLRKYSFRFDGVALNRTLGYLRLSDEDRRSGIAGDASLQAGFDVLASLQSREADTLAQLQRKPIPLAARLPELARDVHSVEDLLSVALAFGPLPAEAARPQAHPT
jgi:anion-transporting  ArsA/GET3 family ATPase